jgi:hypothetical protein
LIVNGPESLQNPPVYPARLANRHPFFHSATTCNAERCLFCQQPIQRSAHTDQWLTSDGNGICPVAASVLVMKHEHVPDPAARLANRHPLAR